MALYNIRIVEGRAGFGLSDRPFCVGNTIYLKGRDTAARPELLVHEVCHVRQFPNRGARHATDALVAQATVVVGIVTAEDAARCVDHGAWRRSGTGAWCGCSGGP